LKNPYFNNFIRNYMNNRVVLIGLMMIATLCGSFSTNNGNYIPFVPNKQNVINFGCGMGDSYSNVAGVSSAGYTFTYGNLPNWVSVVNGPTIAGTPNNASPVAIQVFYTDANGNQGSKIVLLAPQGTSPSSVVSIPAAVANAFGTSNTVSSNIITSGSITTKSNNGFGISGVSSVPVSQFPSLQYVPGFTSPAPGSNLNVQTSSTSSSSSLDTNLVTVVLPALAYPTPGRISIIPPDAPTTGSDRPLAPASSPQENAAVIARQEAAMRGLANALDAVNKANTNYNNLQN
jgi:hypothetical protein